VQQHKKNVVEIFRTYFATQKFLFGYEKKNRKLNQKDIRELRNDKKIIFLSEREKRERFFLR
jgi:hypothetical protein